MGPSFRSKTLLAALLAATVFVPSLGIAGRADNDGMPGWKARSAPERARTPEFRIIDLPGERSWRREDEGSSSRRRLGGDFADDGDPRPVVASPEYYVYKPDPIAPVDFASLIDRPQPAAYSPSADAFGDALGGLDGFVLSAEKPVAEALLAYYGENPRYLWITDGAPNERALEAMRVLSEADAWGLASTDYGVLAPGPAQAADPVARTRDLIRFEMTLSARVLRYLRDASGGRIEANRLSGYHDLPRRPFDGKAELARMARAKDIRAALEGAHPRMPEFAALKQELARLQEAVGVDEPIDPGLLLKPGESSPELPKVLRLVAKALTGPEQADLAAAVAAHGSSESYDETVVPAVMAAQKAKGLRPDGVIGPRTVERLRGGSPADQIRKVRIALEELRWLPRDLGATRVFVNQPAFTATYVEDGSEKLSMAVVVGKPTNQTTFFYDQIEQVDFNPYWGVPQSIIINEMLPRLRRDPGYLDRAGYEVTDSKGRRISSSAVDWWGYSARSPVGVRQAPSEANALGELKILFPNKHAIYMHDTPQKALFKKEVRAFSHGCIRLADPRGMAAAVLGKSLDYVAEKLKEGHSTEKVTRQIPVYVAYFTAWPNASGTVEYFADVYRRDAHLDEAIAATDQARAAGS